VRTTTTIGIGLLLALGASAAAQAHVTLHPASAPAGTEDMRLDVRVPNERDDADTTKLQLELPDGFVQASFEPVPGWTAKVITTKLAKPIKTDDGEVTEQVSEITWTGHGSEGRIPPGGFQDFALSVLVPDKAGSTLTFKAVQTYSNGTVVRWIGPEGSESPAPTLKLDAAAEPAAATTTKPDGSSGSDTLSIIALIVGALGLIAGGAALRRTNRAPAPRRRAPGRA
jgi:periplasmic copper chaperone A